MPDKDGLGNLPRRRAVILTALATECDAVLKHLVDTQEVEHSRGTVYVRGTFLSAKQEWDVIVAEIGQTNPNAGAATERAIQQHDPEVALFVGVAGGVKDVSLGDVVAVDIVRGYEGGKDAGSFKPRGAVRNSAQPLIERAKAERRKNDWLARIKDASADRAPKAFVAPIAAGEKVVADTRSTTYQFLQQQCSDVLAVEMEGIGFLTAVDASPGVDGIIIRGISDLIKDKAVADKAGWQEKASNHASAFAFELLAKYGQFHTHSPTPLNAMDVQEIATRIVNAALMELLTKTRESSNGVKFPDEFKRSERELPPLIDPKAKSVDLFMSRVDDIARSGSSFANKMFLTDVANCISIELNCSIRIVPSTEPEFVKAQALTFSRIIKVSTIWPAEVEYNTFDHFIFFDQNLPHAHAARLIAHELYHVWKHIPTDPNKGRNPDTGAMDYGDIAERASDLFSICLLRHHSYKPGWIPPLTAELFIAFLDNEAGWPDWFTREEVIEFIHKLYANP